MMLEIAGLVLRSPEQLSEGNQRGDSAERLAQFGPALLGVIFLAAGLFGAVLGSYRGGIQHLYAALKTPVLLVAPILVGLPVIRAFLSSCEVQVSWSRLVLTALVAVARTAILAAACGPVLWLYFSVGPGYHSAVLVMTATLVAVGAVGLSTLLRTLPSGGRHRRLAAGASVMVLAVLLAQSGWLLRPFVVRPRAEITFLRPIESDIYSSMVSVRRSAVGDFRGWEAEASGFFGRQSGATRP